MNPIEADGPTKAGNSNPEHDPRVFDIRLDLHEDIAKLIHHKEQEFDYELTQENKVFLINTLSAVILRGVHKFIKGSVEHGPDFLTDVDHMNELFNEQVDSIMYRAAAILTEHKHDDRYK